jgi:hypothetical protein
MQTRQVLQFCYSGHHLLAILVLLLHCMLNLLLVVADECLHSALNIYIRKYC